MNGRFVDAVALGPIILDAGFGTRLIARGLDLAQDDPAFWNLSQPETVRAIHACDVAAGADALVANTFGANRAWLARWGRAAEVEVVNRAAVANAREAGGQGTLLFGSIGPTAAGSPDAVREQALVLADAGVDAILLETLRLDQALTSLAWARSAVALPILVSLVDWPALMVDSARRLADLGASVLGVNCQLGLTRALELIEDLATATPLPLLAKPGAGRPGEAGDSPEQFARAVPRLLACGVRLVGGCCGTTDAHVAALRAACYHQIAVASPLRAVPH